jgi:hypothetical protein
MAWLHRGATRGGGARGSQPAHSTSSLSQQSRGLPYPKPGENEAVGGRGGRSQVGWPFSSQQRPSVTTTASATMHTITTTEQRCALLCHAMLLSGKIPCCAMLCHAVPCCAMLCHAVPCCAMLCHAVPCCDVVAGAQSSLMVRLVVSAAPSHLPHLPRHPLSVMTPRR